MALLIAIVAAAALINLFIFLVDALEMPSGRTFSIVYQLKSFAAGIVAISFLEIISGGPPAIVVIIFLTSFQKYRLSHFAMGGAAAALPVSAMRLSGMAEANFSMYLGYPWWQFALVCFFPVASALGTCCAWFYLRAKGQIPATED